MRFSVQSLFLIVTVAAIVAFAATIYRATWFIAYMILISLLAVLCGRVGLVRNLVNGAIGSLVAIWIWMLGHTAITGLPDYDRRDIDLYLKISATALGGGALLGFLVWLTRRLLENVRRS